MTYLFTKNGCKKCDWVKEKVDLDSVKDLEVLNLDGKNFEALAMLAYYECVTIAEKQLPILIAEDSAIVTGAVQIKNHLLQKNG
jgi:hypothetical protein